MQRTLFDNGYTDFPSKPFNLRHVLLHLLYYSDLIKYDFHFNIHHNIKLLIEKNSNLAKAKHSLPEIQILSNNISETLLEILSLTTLSYNKVSLNWVFVIGLPGT